jgi:hypothetical protein
LETREVELSIGGKPVKKLGLFAQVDALDNLLAIQAKGQKLFSSMEINPAFAQSGKAYLQGLAVTDGPASLGTEVMEFAAGQVKDGKPSPFASRKIEKDNLFSAAAEIEGLEFDDVKPAEGGAAAMFAAATEFFKNFGKAGETPKPEEKPAETPPAAANDNNLAAQIGQGFQQLSAAIAKQGEELNARVAKVESEFGTLKASVESTEKPGTPKRPAAAGGSANYAKTDC